VIAAHDGEIGFGGGDFAEAHIAAVSGVEFGLDVGVGEEDEIEGAWLGLVNYWKPYWKPRWKRWQGGRKACGGEGLEEISAIPLHMYS
jgi:hypothetical protein